MRTHLLAALALSSFGVVSVAQATSYNPATDWSISSNPNGIWSYGYLDPSNPSTATNLTLFNTSHNDWDGSHPGVQNWDLNNGAFGAVAENTTGSQKTVWSTIQIDPGQLIEHPGNATNLAADVRFTAPAPMTVDISALYAAADTGGTTTDVHVYVNGVSVFDSTVNGIVGHSGSSTSYSSPAPIALTQGETVDFSVGYGADGAYQNDGTSLAASINTVPEPATLSLLSFGALALLARRRVV